MAEDRLQLKITTPERLVFDKTVDEVVAPGIVGEFGILPGHLPFITTLTPGQLKYKEGSTEGTMIIHSGIAEVNENVINIIVDDAEDPEKVDRDAARKELNDLEYELDNSVKSSEEAEEIITKIKLAKLRLGTEYYEKSIG